MGRDRERRGRKWRRERKGGKEGRGKGKGRSRDGTTPINAGYGPVVLC